MARQVRVAAPLAGGVIFASQIRPSTGTCHVLGPRDPA